MLTDACVQKHAFRPKEAPSHSHFRQYRSSMFRFLSRSLCLFRIQLAQNDEAGRLILHGSSSRPLASKIRSSSGSLGFELSVVRCSIVQAVSMSVDVGCSRVFSDVV